MRSVRNSALPPVGPCRPEFRARPEARRRRQRGQGRAPPPHAPLTSRAPPVGRRHRAHRASLLRHTVPRDGHRRAVDVDTRRKRDVDRHRRRRRDDGGAPGRAGTSLAIRTTSSSRATASASTLTVMAKRDDRHPPGGRALSMRNRRRLLAVACPPGLRMRSVRDSALPPVARRRPEFRTRPEARRTRQRGQGRAPPPHAPLTSRTPPVARPSRSPGVSYVTPSRVTGIGVSLTSICDGNVTSTAIAGDGVTMAALLAAPERAWRSARRGPPPHLATHPCASRSSRATSSTASSAPVRASGRHNRSKGSVATGSIGTNAEPSTSSAKASRA